VNLTEDIEGVDWEVMADLYRRAYNGVMTSQRIENIFKRSYMTHIALLDGQIVAVYALSDGVRRHNSRLGCAGVSAAWHWRTTHAFDN